MRCGSVSLHSMITCLFVCFQPAPVWHFQRAQEDQGDFLRCVFYAFVHCARSQFTTATVCLFVFDVLYIDGESLLDKTFDERRALLESHLTVVPGHVLLAELHKPEASTFLFTRCCACFVTCLPGRHGASAAHEDCDGQQAGAGMVRVLRLAHARGGAQEGLVIKEGTQTYRWWPGAPPTSHTSIPATTPMRGIRFVVMVFASLCSHALAVICSR